MSAPTRSIWSRPLLIGALAATALLVLTVLVAMRESGLIGFDEGLSNRARAFAEAQSWWRVVMSSVTHTADTMPMVLSLVISVALLLWRRLWPAALFVVAAAASGTAARLIILAIVARPRPPGPFTATSGWAFPSGHTTAAGIAAGAIVALTFTLQRLRPWRWLLAPLAAGWAVLVGVSRIALLAHWPTDVIGGWLLALAAIAVAIGAIRPRS